MQPHTRCILSLILHDKRKDYYCPLFLAYLIIKEFNFCQQFFMTLFAFRKVIVDTENNFSTYINNSVSLQSNSSSSFINNQDMYKK